MTARPDVPGSTRSLPLRPLARDRASGAAVLGLAPRAVRPFSLLGVVWDDPATELHGRVRVRTRATGTGAWSGWRDVETHYADHGGRPGRRGGRRGRGPRRHGAAVGGGVGRGGDPGSAGAR
ncbi:hypothetical protein GCM10023238_16770 [Streptomyces heliomycini]